MSAFNEISLPCPLYRKIDGKTAHSALEYSCKKLNYTIDRSNMNPRSIAERIDDKVMGDIASLEVKNFLDENGVYAKAYDELRNDKYQLPDSGWDVVAGVGAKRWVSRLVDPSVPDKDVIKLSIKSSRIPRRRTIEDCISNFDFKIFKAHHAITDDLVADIEVQVYYQYEESRFSGFNVTLDEVNRARQEGYQEIMEKLEILNRYRMPILTAFINREEMVNISQNLARKNRATWVSSHEGYQKEMWRMPLKCGYDMRKLPLLL